MGEISFFLRKTGDDFKPQPIYFRFQEGRKADFKKSIRQRVLIKNWDLTKQKVRNKSNLPDRDGINGLINNLRTHFNEFNDQNTKEGITPSVESIRNHFNQFFTDENENRPSNFFDYFNFYISSAKSQINPRTNKPKTDGTIRTYVVTYNILKRFNDEVRRITWDNLNLEFYQDFISFCEKEDFTINYIGKHVKTLKAVIRSAIESKITTNDSFLSKKVVVFNETADSIYLNLDELKKIVSLDLKENHLITARDLFLIGAFTGSRVSDYKKLSHENITQKGETKILSYKQQKTGKDVSIPLNPTVESIFNKYKETGLPNMPDQKINLYMKQIGKLAEIDEPIYFKEHRGGEVIKLSKPKYELIKTHTARRSFCTNAYLSGIEPLMIMNISGHTTINNFLKYIKTTPEERAVEMGKHPFFRN